ncbi:MAG: hypothetical protein AAGJ87_09090 [Pseudomonadota bacterium]
MKANPVIKNGGAVGVLGASVTFMGDPGAADFATNFCGSISVGEGAMWCSTIVTEKSVKFALAGGALSSGAVLVHSIAGGAVRERVRALSALQKSKENYQRYLMRAARRFAERDDQHVYGTTKAALGIVKKSVRFRRRLEAISVSTDDEGVNFEGKTSPDENTVAEMMLLDFRQYLKDNNRRHGERMLKCAQGQDMFPLAHLDRWLSDSVR